MNHALPPDLILPDAQARRQIFYLLKKESSWTAWSRAGDYYKAWVDIVRDSVRQADDHGWMTQTGVPHSDYVLILKGYAHFEEGLRRLRNGDKRVFQYNAHGEFAMALRAFKYWQRLLQFIESGDSGIDEAHTPNWPAITEAILDFGYALADCAQDIMESQDLDDPAPNVYGVWYQKHLPKMPFPDPLPEVPDPADNVLVYTGRTIPCSGIWEPVDVPRPKGLQLFKSPAPRGPFPIIGCMNYLHGGSPAPQASLETETDNPDVDATWRLLWRDDRYQDGTIPEEESGYQFIRGWALSR